MQFGRDTHYLRRRMVVRRVCIRSNISFMQVRSRIHMVCSVYCVYDITIIFINWTIIRWWRSLDYLSLALSYVTVFPTKKRTFHFQFPAKVTILHFFLLITSRCNTFFTIDRPVIMFLFIIVMNPSCGLWPIN